MPPDLASNYDSVIVGGGHNGLVAAAYLARAGLTTCVLERRDRIGGAAVTEEIVPGYRFSRASYVNSLLRPEIIQELALRRHGFELLPRDPSSFTPTLDGRSLLLGTDSKSNYIEISKFSTRDAEAFAGYEALLDRCARFIEPTLDRPPPDLESSSWIDRSSSLIELSQLGLRALKLGPDLPRFLEILTAPAAKIITRWFESEPLRGTLATDALIGAMAAPSTPGSGYVLFHHIMGETDGARGVWAYVRGGMGQLSESIASAARAAGAQIITDAPVASIRSEGGRARGVILEDGREVSSRCVLSGADPNVTFRRLVDPSDLPSEFNARMDELDYSSAVFKINVAVDRIPCFSVCPGEEPGAHHRGTIHLNSTLEEMEAAFADAQRGEPSREPVVEMTIPSVLDDSLAPEGHHVISLFVQYAPYQLAAGSWDDPGRREAFADRVFAAIERHAPGFTASIVGRDLLSPLDLERVFGLTGGNIFHGAMSLDQLFWLRPARGWARYRTPIRGLYLCGSGAHPGGGIIGAPGRNAARQVIRDLRGLL